MGGSPAPAAGSGEASSTPVSELPPLNHNIYAPTGPFLQPKPSGSEYGRPSLLRAGFPLYPSSSHFVERLQIHVTDVLDDFVDDWTEVNDQERESGPFVLFRRNWENLNLHMVQFFWSENAATRIAFYETWTRVCLGHLSPLLPRQEEDDVESIEMRRLLLRAVGAVFSVYIIRSTTMLGTRIQTWDRRKRPLVDIEADLHRVLVSLPERISDDGILADETYLDFAFIFDDLLGNSHDDGSAFHILAPTDLGARRPLITNHLSTRAFTQRQSRPWGTLQEVDGSTRYPLTKSELGRALVRQRLGLEHVVPVQRERKDTPLHGHSDELTSSRHSRKRLRLDLSGVYLTSAHGPQKPKDKAEKELEQSLRRVAEARQGYLNDGDVVRRLLSKQDTTKERSSERASPLSKQESPVSLEDIVEHVQATTGRAIDRAYDAFQARQKNSQEDPQRGS